MNRETYRTSISAGHLVKDHPVCGRGDHGHDYRVEMAWEEDPAYELVERATSIVHEFNGRSLNRMMPASDPTAGGLARYLLERMQILGVVEVTVVESNEHTSTASRLPR